MTMTTQFCSLALSNWLHAQLAPSAGNFTSNVLLGRTDLASLLETGLQASCSLVESTSCFSGGQLAGAIVGTACALLAVALLCKLMYAWQRHSVVARQPPGECAGGSKPSPPMAATYNTGAAAAAQDTEVGERSWRSQLCCWLSRVCQAGLRPSNSTSHIMALNRASIDTAPRAGPDTTLLLSDCQNSTSLWEMLPTNVMDQCMRLHDDCLRQHLGRHEGYESATEGDAFILAFRTPAAALAYAMEVQAALLELAWPAQLLANPDGRPVYVLLGQHQPAKQHSDGAVAHASKALWHDLLPSLSKSVPPPKTWQVHAGSSQHPLGWSVAGDAGPSTSVHNPSHTHLSSPFSHPSLGPTQLSATTPAFAHRSCHPALLPCHSNHYAGSQHFNSHLSSTRPTAEFSLPEAHATTHTNDQQHCTASGSANWPQPFDSPAIHPSLRHGLLLLEPPAPGLAAPADHALAPGSSPQGAEEAGGGWSRGASLGADRGTRRGVTWHPSLDAQPCVSPVAATSPLSPLPSQHAPQGGPTPPPPWPPAAPPPPPPAPAPPFRPSLSAEQSVVVSSAASEGSHLSAGHCSADMLAAPGMLLPQSWDRPVPQAVQSQPRAHSNHQGRGGVAAPYPASSPGFASWLAPNAWLHGGSHAGRGCEEVESSEPGQGYLTWGSDHKSRSQTAAQTATAWGRLPGDQPGLDRPGQEEKGGEWPPAKASEAGGALPSGLWSWATRSGSHHHQAQGTAAEPGAQPLPAPAGLTKAGKHQGGVMGGHGSGLGLGLPPVVCCQWARQLGLALPRVRESEALKAGPGGSALIFRGLRVRMGMHTGITDPADVVFEPVSGRTIYTGPCMELARAVSDAAPGGGLLLSAEAFVRLPHSSLAPTTTVDELVNGGSMLTSSLSRAAATFSRRGLSFDLRPSARSQSPATPHPTDSTHPAINALLLYAGDHSLTKLATYPPQALYMAVPASMPGRLPWMVPLRNVVLRVQGTSFAPTGTATIAFANVVHAASLLSEVPTAARQALNTFQAVCLAALTQHQGYAVELVDGLLLAAFHEPWHAIVWALDCQQAMARQAWPAELLDHLAGLGKPPSAAAAGAVEGPAKAAEAAAGGAAGAAAAADGAVAGRGAAGEAGGGVGVSSKGGVEEVRPSAAPGEQDGAAAQGSQDPPGPVEGQGQQLPWGTSWASLQRQQNPSQPASPPAASPLGLQLKIGLDVGRVAATVMPQTGRIHYRGKVMNRAARVCSRCLPGQVLATGLVWEYSAQQGGLQAAGVRGDALGPAEMKGVPGLIELVHCYLGPPDCPARPDGRPSCSPRPSPRSPSVHSSCNQGNALQKTHHQACQPPAPKERPPIPPLPHPPQPTRFPASLLTQLILPSSATASPLSTPLQACTPQSQLTDPLFDSPPSFKEPSLRPLPHLPCAAAVLPCEDTTTTTASPLSPLPLAQLGRHYPSLGLMTTHPPPTLQLAPHMLPVCPPVTLAAPHVPGPPPPPSPQQQEQQDPTGQPGEQHTLGPSDPLPTLQPGHLAHPKQDLPLPDPALPERCSLASSHSLLQPRPSLPELQPLANHPSWPPLALPSPAMPANALSAEDPAVAGAAPAPTLPPATPQHPSPLQSLQLTDLRAGSPNYSLPFLPHSPTTSHSLTLAMPPSNCAWHICPLWVGEHGPGQQQQQEQGGCAAGHEHGLGGKGKGQQEGQVVEHQELTGSCSQPSSREELAQAAGCPEELNAGGEVPEVLGGACRRLPSRISPETAWGVPCSTFHPSVHPVTVCDPADPGPSHPQHMTAAAATERQSSPEAGHGTAMGCGDQAPSPAPYPAPSSHTAFSHTLQPRHSISEMPCKFTSVAASAAWGLAQVPGEPAGRVSLRALGRVHSARDRNRLLHDGHSSAATQWLDVGPVAAPPCLAPRAQCRSPGPLPPPVYQDRPDTPSLPSVHELGEVNFAHPALSVRASSEAERCSALSEQQLGLEVVRRSKGGTTVRDSSGQLRFRVHPRLVDDAVGLRPAHPACPGPA